MITLFNPIYDQAFKYLMENNELAKKILHLILDKEIVQLQMKNIEFPIANQDGIVTARYDFKALIKEADGEMQKVLIELQKYKSPNPIPRFSEYLGQNYQYEDTYMDSEGQTKTEHLPIIAIYILGYDLPEFKSRFIEFDTVAIDGITKKELGKIKSNFIKYLTHKTYLLLVGEKKNYTWKGGKIESFIRLFRQKTKGAEKNIFIEIDEQEISDPLINEIVDRLHRATENEQLKRQMRREKEYDDALKDQEKMEEEIETLKKQKEEERRQKLKAEEKAEEERRQKLKAEEKAKEERQQKEEERRQKEEERRQKEEALKKLKLSALEMKKLGMSLENISLFTGLSVKEIESL